MPLVRVDGIAIDAGGRALFADTSFDVLEDENWAIVGRSGSGKSLLSMALAGQVPLARGTIRYEFLSGPDSADARFGWFPSGSVIRVSPDDHRQMATGAGRYHQARWHASESSGRDTCPTS